MAKEELQGFVLASGFGVELDIEIFHGATDVDEFFQVVDGFDGTGEEFVEALLEEDGGGMGEVFAMDVMEIVGVVDLLGGTAAKSFMAELLDFGEMGFVKAAEGGGADIETEAFGGRSGAELLGFGVGVVAEPEDELLFLLRRNFFGE